MNRQLPDKVAQGFFVGLFVMAGLLALFPSFLTHSHAASERRGRKELVAAYKAELKEFDRKQKAELADLKASQKARRKDFEIQGKAQRRECFKKATRGSERRVCVKDLTSRREAMLQLMKEEFQRRKDELSARRRSLEDEQKRKLADFDAGVVGPVTVPSSISTNR